MRGSRNRQAEEQGPRQDHTHPIFYLLNTSGHPEGQQPGAVARRPSEPLSPPISLSLNSHRLKGSKQERKQCLTPTVWFGVVCLFLLRRGVIIVVVILRGGKRICKEKGVGALRYF